MKRILIMLCVFVLSATGCTTAPTDTAGTSELQWDRETDMLVVGYGLAGEAAALEASDVASDADILVIEKMPEKLAGGNSIASGQTFIVPARDDLETFTTYMEACAEPNPIPEEYMTWLVDDFANQVEWISQTVKEVGYEVGYVGGGPARWGSLVVEFKDLPGADFKGASCHIRKEGETFMLGGIWHGFNNAVKQRENITVEYETAGVKLIQDLETKRVEGVLAIDSTGNEVRIKANKGVVLATGGFENNLEMQRNLHGVDVAYTSGTPGNTGDGIKMLSEVGAKLWHVNNQTQSGGYWFGLKTPEFDSSFILNMTYKTGEYMQIDAEGKRFFNESETYYGQHMKDKEFGKYLDLPHDRALPVHMIFDESFRQNNSVVSPWLSWPITTEGYVWDKDNAKEIEKGWIHKADTIEELALLIDRDPIALRAEVDRYNSMVEKGIDEDFNREIGTMGKIITAPFYAFEVVPALVATTGGAERNTNSQVLDWNNEVIPGLYEAGELGSYVSNLYQNGVFLSEAIASGRAAAQHMFGAESTKFDEDFKILDQVEKPEHSIFEDELSKEYLIECESMHGPFTLQTKISDGKLTLLDVTDGKEELYDIDALYELFDLIISGQTLDVDVIAGATNDCQSVLDNLNKTFNQ